MSSGALAVFSPTALTAEVRESVNGLGGNVAYLAALDFEHHVFLGEWHKAFPSAKVLGPEGLAEKRATQKNEAVPFHSAFTESNKSSMAIDEAFDRDFEYEYVGGHGNKELVFNFKPERTMIEADLMFNLPATEQYSRSGAKATDGFLTRLFGGIMSTTGDAVWQKRFLWYVASSKARPSFDGSIQRIAKWDFDRIIPCHGDVIETGGKAVFNKVFAWHLPATPAGMSGQK